MRYSNKQSINLDRNKMILEPIDIERIFDLKTLKTNWNIYLLIER
jgi:hypothetical protein